MRQGDKVTLRPDLKIGNQYGGITFYPSMDFIGERYIEEIIGRYYIIGHYHYTLEMLQPDKPVFALLKKWKWVGVDKDGTVTFFTHKPARRNEMWGLVKGQYEITTLFKVNLTWADDARCI